MKILEYGDEKNPAVLLIHGMACEGRHSFSKVIPLLKENYRVLVPLLDGHDKQKTTFTSIEDQARHIFSYLSEHVIKQFDVKCQDGGRVCIHGEVMNE
ncbi:MAG: hypothetical protein E7256_14180 [Lachnospiraceae bacterium]|nr:hypothetical protein [Lachnospiraceae bacterium]